MPIHFATPTLIKLAALLGPSLGVKKPEYDGDTCILYKNKDEWVSIRLDPNPYSGRGFTYTVWGYKPQVLDEEAETARIIDNVMGFPGIEEDAHVLRIARKYFFKCSDK